MPLPEVTRQEVVSYVLKHVVPKSIRPRPQKAMEWFEGAVCLHSRPHAQKTSSRSFVSGTIHRPLAGNARSSGRIQPPLHQESNTAYASILEDPDRLLSRVPQSPLDGEGIFREKVLKEVKNVFLHGHVSPTLVTTRHTTSFSAAKRREIAIKEIRFEQRVAIAVGLGLIPKGDSDFIERLYKPKLYHLINSAARDFTPDKAESSKAFRTLCRIPNHLRTWTQPPNGSALLPERTSPTPA